MLSKYTNGFICGIFDTVTDDEIFKDCKEQCSNLIVAIQTDPTLDRKIKRKPAYGIYERFMFLDSISEIDKIIPYDTEADLFIMLKELEIDVRFLGKEYKDKFFTGDEMDIPIHYI